MRPISIFAAVVSAACTGLHIQPVAAETFEDRWSIIPKAKAEPSPQLEKHDQPQPATEAQSNPRARTEPAPPTRNRSNTRTFRRAFSGKASYYSYRGGKTASGSPFNRNALTAAHRSLPFGTRLRVTDVATSKSVVVVINDRGPMRPGRVLDLSLGAARNLGITERGVVHVRAEVLG